MKTRSLPFYARLLLPALFLLLFLPHFSRAGAKHSLTDPIVVGGDYSYPPYEFLDENGKPTGFNVELTQAIAEVMGVEVKIELGIWGDMIRELKEGKIDALQGMVSSEERADLFDFSPPHSVIHQSVFARRDAPSIGSLNELVGKSVIVQQNGAMYDYFLKHHFRVNLILTQTHAEALTLLASGKYDYAVVANLPGLYLGKELKLTNIVRVAEPVAAAPYGYAVLQGNREVLALFSEGLAILKNTGKYNEIKNKWLSPLEPPRIPWKRLIKYGSMFVVPLLLVLVGTVVWNRTLRRRVAIATSDLKREIIERKRAAKEAKLQQQQLIQADKMATLGILASGVAHEINNPAGLILLNTPLLGKIYRVATDSLEKRFDEEGDFMIGGMPYSQIREEIPRMLDEMHDSAQRIKRIVNDLKDFARQENAELLETVEINDVVTASLRLVDTTIRKATTNFSVVYGRGLPKVRGNAQRIEQVLVNLIINSCQALPGSERGITVSTGFDSEQNEVWAEVADEGVGIAEADLKHVLDPFFTTKRGEGGTGLGLSVSDGIVKDHHGRLDFQSEPDSGTRVRMVLPALDMDKESA